MFNLCPPFYLLFVIAISAIVFLLIALRRQINYNHRNSENYDNNMWLYVALLLVAVFSTIFFVAFTFMRLGGC
jgi:uncharacterized membrane protein